MPHQTAGHVACLPRSSWASRPVQIAAVIAARFRPCDAERREHEGSSRRSSGNERRRRGRGSRPPSARRSPGTFCDTIATTKSGMPMLIVAVSEKAGIVKTGMCERDVNSRLKSRRPERRPRPRCPRRASPGIA